MPEKQQEREHLIAAVLTWAVCIAFVVAVVVLVLHSAHGA